MPILRRGLPLAVAAAGARGAAPVVCEEKPLQRLLLRDGQQQVGREQATEEAVPLCALPAGLLRAPPLPGALPGAPEGPSGGGHSGLQGSRAAPVNVNVNVGGVTLKGDCVCLCFQGVWDGPECLAEAANHLFSSTCW